LDKSPEEEFTILMNEDASIQKPQETPAVVSSGAAFRARTGLLITILGFIVFLIGAKPEWLGLDRSPVVGFVQVTVFSIGLAIICVGGYMGLSGLWMGKEKTIPAEIGPRLISTGFVVALFAGMADIFGLGSHPLPGVPVFGHLQSLGVQIGLIVIALGFLMMVPFHLHRK
jgi:hypothetical protein